MTSNEIRSLKFYNSKNDGHEYYKLSFLIERNASFLFDNSKDELLMREHLPHFHCFACEMGMHQSWCNEFISIVRLW